MNSRMSNSGRCECVCVIIFLFHFPNSCRSSRAVYKTLFPHVARRERESVATLIVLCATNAPCVSRCSVLNCHTICSSVRSVNKSQKKRVICAKSYSSVLAGQAHCAYTIARRRLSGENWLNSCLCVDCVYVCVIGYRKM